MPPRARNFGFMASTKAKEAQRLRANSPGGASPTGATAKKSELFMLRLAIG